MPVIKADPLLVEQRKARVIRHQDEPRGDAGALGTGLQQPLVSTSTDRKPQGDQENRFSGTGFAGQHAEPRFET